jgi:hypothetical protein
VSGIHRVERWGNQHLQTGKGDNVEAILPGITSVTDNPSLATGASLTYRSANQFNNSWNWNIHYRAAISYITGSHNIKVGFNNAFLHYENTTYMSPTTDYSFNFINGVASQLVYRIPRKVAVDVNRDLGLFAQDRWSVGRWTLSGGIRFDNFQNRFPPQSISASSLAPTLNVNYDEIKSLNWKDITPKMGVAYDLFGNGKTAVKATLNKYLEGLGTTGFGPAQVSDLPNPINRIIGVSTNLTRPWTDADGDFFPDCNLTNYQINGECGVLTSAATFGTFAPGQSFDPNLMTGWGKRFFNWEFTTSVQHELRPRVAIGVQYARRWYGNLRVNDDRSVTAADYTRFNFTVPTDSRLPNSGGTLTGFDITSAGAARPLDYFTTLSNNFGKMTEHFDGVNISVNARLRNGLTMQAGVGPGRVVTDDCEIVDDLPEMLHTLAGNPNRSFVFAARPLERCHQNNGWRTGVTGLASYTLPKIDVLISGTLQNLPGGQAGGSTSITSLDANATILAANTTLGRAFTNAPNRMFNISPAGEVFVERLNQIDLRVAKIFRMGTTRTSVNFDFYNITNSNSVTTENATYTLLGWRTPTAILLPRLFKLSAQFDF